MAERRNLGVAFYRAGMAEEATREFRQVLELRPDDPSAGFHLALLALRQGKEREAVRRLKLLVEASGESYAAFVNLAFAFMRLGRAEDALLALHEAEAIRPATPKVALMRAAVHIGGGDTDGATETLAEYQLRLRPGDTPTAPFYHFAALVAGLAGRLDMAQSTIEEGLATHSESAPLLLLAGAIAERRGDLDRAERYYAKAADIDSSLPQVHKNLGDIAYRRGDHEGAIEHYRRALELDPRLGDDITRSSATSTTSSRTARRRCAAGASPGDQSCERGGPATSRWWRMWPGRPLPGLAALPLATVSRRGGRAGAPGR